MKMETEIKEVKHRKPKKLPVYVSQEDLLAILKEVEESNPYPLDIFTGITQEGKIARHCHNVWNNCLDKFKELLEKSELNSQHKADTISEKDLQGRSVATGSETTSADTQIQNEINKDYALEGLSEKESGK